VPTSYENSLSALPSWKLKSSFATELGWPHPAKCLGRPTAGPACLDHPDEKIPPRTLLSLFLSDSRRRNPRAVIALLVSNHPSPWLPPRADDPARPPRAAPTLSSSRFLALPPRRPPRASLRRRDSPRLKPRLAASEEQVQHRRRWQRKPSTGSRGILALAAEESLHWRRSKNGRDPVAFSFLGRDLIDL
jgi:hypothetical protein